jgi:hypothetical protein
VFSGQLGTIHSRFLVSFEDVFVVRTISLDPQVIKCVVECLDLLICLWGLSVSNLGPDTSYTDGDFVFFSVPPESIALLF